MTSPSPAVVPSSEPDPANGPTSDQALFEAVFDPARVSEQAGGAPDLVLDGVGYAYGWLRRHRDRRTWQLPGASVTFRGGTITALLGRNGAGKSTLLDLAAGLRRPVAGNVRLVSHAGAQEVWDNPVPRAAVTLLGSRPVLPASQDLKDSARLWRMTRPLWSDTDLRRYLTLLDLSPEARPSRLSRGQRAAADAAFALASHSPVLLLDEVHLGMDAVVRRRFWDALLELYAWEHPTIVIASHDVDQIEDLVEDVVVLAGGRVAAAGSADGLRAQASAPGEGLASLTDVLELLGQAPGATRHTDGPDATGTRGSAAGTPAPAAQAPGEEPAPPGRATGASGAYGDEER